MERSCSRTESTSTGVATSRADGAADLDAAHARHHQVGDHQVRRPLAEEPQALFGIVGRAHVVALRGERGAQHARDLRFVVDDQNSAGMSLFFHRKITSSRHCISETRGRYDSGGEDRWALRPMHGRLFAGWRPRLAAALTTFLLVWLGANSTTAGMVFLVLVVWSATQAGTVLSLYIAVVCAHLLRLFLPAAAAYVSAGGRAAVGGDDLVSWPAAWW